MFLCLQWYDMSWNSNFSLVSYHGFLKFDLFTLPWLRLFVIFWNAHLQSLVNDTCKWSQNRCLSCMRSQIIGLMHISNNSVTVLAIWRPLCLYGSHFGYLILKASNMHSFLSCLITKIWYFLKFNFFIAMLFVSMVIWRPFCLLSGHFGYFKMQIYNA
jgi:hypothetical protein